LDRLHRSGDPKCLELACRDFLLFVGRMNVAHRHLDLRVAEQEQEQEDAKEKSSSSKTNLTLTGLLQII